MKDPKHILITGANSGLGKALALAYAQKNCTVFLSGRNSKRLEEIKAQCEAQGAIAHTAVIDVRDAHTMQEWIHSIDDTHPLDLVIANAGVSAGTGGLGESDAQVKQLFDINLYGVLNTIHPAIERMKSRKKGQIAIISSLAGFRGLPSSPAYSGSKAAVRIYGEALRGHLFGSGVELSVITPGYIRTPMTDVNTFPMPFIMDAEKAANKIKHKLTKNPARYGFPWPLYWLVWLMSTLPPCLTDPIFARLPAKESIDTQQ